VNYQHLVAFIAYVKTCLVWMEAHPEIAYEGDKRVQNHLGALLEDEPCLADFFRNYREGSGVNASAKGSIWLSLPGSGMKRRYGKQPLRSEACTCCCFSL